MGESRIETVAVHGGERRPDPEGAVANTRAILVESIANPLMRVGKLRA